MLNGTVQLVLRPFDGIRVQTVYLFTVIETNLQSNMSLRYGATAMSLVQLELDLEITQLTCTAKLCTGGRSCNLHTARFLHSLNIMSSSSCFAFQYIQEFDVVLLEYYQSKYE